MQGLYKYEICVSYKESHSQRESSENSVSETGKGSEGVDPPAEGWVVSC